jgi:hypothetical protein
MFFVTLARLEIFCDWRPDLLFGLTIRLMFLPVSRGNVDNFQLLRSGLCTVSPAGKATLIPVPDDMGVLAYDENRSSQ